jgi:GrpB-like predicted nucleotidyltransferase (UPF0157 family)
MSDNRQPGSAPLLASERDRLLEVFSGTPVVIEPAGACAIPGLRDLPVLDLLLGAPLLSDIERRVRAIEGLGYRYVPEAEAALPERRLFVRRPAAAGVSVQLHATRIGSGFWNRHLRLQQLLREQPEVAQAYLVLQKNLAGRQRRDPRGCAAELAAFIQQALGEEDEEGVNLAPPARQEPPEPPDLD